MNRTHLEGAAEKLTAQRGYTFYTGPEGDMGHTVRNYPAAWLAPPELHAVEGRTHGRATYDMTLHLLRPGARISPAERRTALAEMETQMLEIFAELSLYERILAVEGLSVRTAATRPGLRARNRNAGTLQPATDTLLQSAATTPQTSIQMTFTQIPPEYAPLSGELRYTVTTQETATLDLRIADAGNGTLIGAKRFAGVTSASFDAAPYLRRTVAFVPTTGSTGFRMADGRTVTAYIEAQAAQATGTAPTVHSPLRTFLPCRTNVTAFALLTSMPLVRLISHGESDELTLFSDEAVTVTVTAQSGTTTTAESYRTATGGLHVFRLDTRDFPEAETLTVDAGACGSVAYTVISAPTGARRLAWRSSAGGIEHYTFPVEKSESVETIRQRAYGAEGHLVARTRAERRTVLVSAYEPRATLEGLSEVLSSPDVWLAEDDGYTAVDVVTEKSVLHRHGAVTCLEIEIRPKRKTGMPWN